MSALAPLRMPLSRGTTVTPLEAIRREIEIELAALERRLGPKACPTAICIRVKLDPSSNMPAYVEVTEERTRKLAGRSIA